MASPMIQKDVEGPFWLVKGRRVCFDTLRNVVIVVRAHNAVEAKEKAGVVADGKKWLGFRASSAELYE